MTVSAKVGSFMITGTLSTQQSVSVGFQPKAILFWVNGRTETTDANGRANHKRGFGAATSPTDRRFIASLAQDTPTAMLTNETQGNAACIGITTTADAIDGLMDIQSIDAGGFTTIVDDAFTANYIAQYLALGGDEITNVATGQFTGVSGSTQDVTSLAFQPDCVIIFSSGQTTANNTVRADSRIFIGAATSSAQSVWAGGSNDGAGTSVAISVSRSGECLVTLNSGLTGIENRAQLDSFLSNGFRITWNSQTTSGVVYFFIALKGGSYNVGNLLTQLDTTTDIVETFGFSPSASLFLSHMSTENSAGSTTTNDRLSIGAFSDVSTRRAMSMGDSSAAPTAIVSTGISYDEVYQNLSAADGSILAEMDIKSVDSSGFTCIMDDADIGNNFVWYLAFGSTPVAGGLVQPVFSDDEIQGTLFGGQVVR